MTARIRTARLVNYILGKRPPQAIILDEVVVIEGGTWRNVDDDDGRIWATMQGNHIHFHQPPNTILVLSENGAE